MKEKIFFDLSETSSEEIRISALQFYLSENQSVHFKTQKDLKNEIKSLPKHLRKIHKVDPYYFTDEYFDMMFDVSLYFGELLIANNPKLRWKKIDDPKYAEFGFPSISNDKGSFHKSPYYMINVLAHQIYSGSAQEDRLSELFIIWRDLFAQM